MEVRKRMTVVVEAGAFGLIMHWVNKANPHEVGGLWKVRQKGNLLICYEPVLSKQRSATDELFLNHDPDWIMDYQDAAGYCSDPLPVATYGSWHSHGSGGVLASSDDAEFIEAHVSRGFFVTTIFNVKAEYKSQVHTLLGEPEDETVTMVEIPCVTALSDGLSSEEREKADAQFDELVTWYKRKQGKGKNNGTTVGRPDTSWPSGRDNRVWECSHCSNDYNTHERLIKDGTYGPHAYTGRARPYNSTEEWVSSMEPVGERDKHSPLVSYAKSAKARGHKKPLVIKTTDGNTLEVYRDGTLSFLGDGVDFQRVLISGEIMKHLETVMTKKEFKRVAKYASAGRP